MSEHYFSKKPTSEHDFNFIKYKVPDTDQFLNFKTDAGVFSKKGIDKGSDLLIKTIKPTINSKVLDIGCGYGVIGLSLSIKEPTINLTLADINSRAIKLADFNAENNDIKAKVLQSDGFENINELFDLIVFNPPIRAGKDVYYKIIKDSYDALKKEGSLVVVVRKKQGGPSLFNYLKELFNNSEKINRSGGYWILKSMKK
ncbi:MAG: class I SAM-dependent methyltransferase [Clostridia bacterium]